MEHFLDPFGGVGQHGFEGNSRSETAVIWEGCEAVSDEGRDEDIVTGMLASGWVCIYVCV